jgi:hypothetical protein
VAYESRLIRIVPTIPEVEGHLIIEKEPLSDDALETTRI